MPVQDPSLHLKPVNNTYPVLLAWKDKWGPTVAGSTGVANSCHVFPLSVVFQCFLFLPKT